MRRQSTARRIGMYVKLPQVSSLYESLMSWKCYWSMLDGADGITWSDANLTEAGQGQAKDVHALWKELLPKGIPPPETYYVSPLTRTIETADLSFKGLELPKDKPYSPYIKEVRDATSTARINRTNKASSSSEKPSESTPATAAAQPPTSSKNSHTSPSSQASRSPTRYGKRTTANHVRHASIACRSC